MAAHNINIILQHHVELCTWFRVCFIRLRAALIVVSIRLYYPHLNTLHVSD
jgi:hypothetical protein